MKDSFEILVFPNYFIYNVKRKAYKMNKIKKKKWHKTKHFILISNSINYNIAITLANLNINIIKNTSDIIRIVIKVKQTNFYIKSSVQTIRGNIPKFQEKSIQISKRLKMKQCTGIPPNSIMIKILTWKSYFIKQN